MNETLTFLKFTKEVPEDFEDKKLPTLDLKIWLRDGRLWYQFFEKIMSNNVVIQEKSALSESVKIASLTEHVIRRLKNTSQDLPIAYRLEALEGLSQKMANSGHKPEFMKRILTTGICKYERKLAASRLDGDDPNYQKLHQPSGKSVARLKKKALARGNWFKDKKNDNKFNNKFNNTTNHVKNRKETKDQQAGNTKKIQASTVMSLPSTRGGIFLKNMRGNEALMVAMTGFKVSYTELAGVKLGRIFTPNLSKGQPCGRESCQPCTKNDPDKIQNCRTRSILYQSACSVCNPPGRKDKKTSHREDDDHTPAIREGIYYGESSRSLAERAAEHFKDAKNFDKGSHMVKHWIEKHPEMNTLPPFTITILRSFKDCLTRQVSEAVTMYLSKDKLLNSKNEYVQNCISRVTVEEDKYQRKLRERQEEQEDLENTVKLEKFKKERVFKMFC